MSVTEAPCLSGDECAGEAVESTAFPGELWFCTKHQEQLDRCRAELANRSWEKNVRNKEHVNEKYCETPYCPHRPIYGSDYCKICIGND